jgi:hypothetical protein
VETKPKHYGRNERSTKEQGPSNRGRKPLRKKTKHGCNTAVSRVEMMKNAEGLKASQGASSYGKASQKQETKYKHQLNIRHAQRQHRQKHEGGMKCTIKSNPEITNLARPVAPRMWGQEFE